MNLLGKIFVVLIFFMAILYLGLATAVYATHKNWRKVVDNPNPTRGEQLGLVQQNEQKEKKIKELDGQLSEAKRREKIEKDAAAQSRAKLETERVRYKGELDALTQQAESLDKKLRESVAELNRAMDELARRRTEVEQLRADIRKAEKDRDDHFKEVVRVTDELNQSANEIARLKALNLSLNEQLGNAREVLRKFGLVDDPNFYANVPPKLDSIVTDVSAEGLVEIKIGHDDGLRPGHQLEVTRTFGGALTYVGRIEVVKTWPERSVCKILVPYRKSEVQKGDRVDAKQL